MSNQKLVIARHSATLAPCRLCRKPNPPEDLSRSAICKTCWMQEGANAPGGCWVLVPPGMALVPVQMVQQSNMGAAMACELQTHCGERGVEEPPFFALRRLLEERAILLREYKEEAGYPASEGSEGTTARCCYCGETEEVLIEAVFAKDGLPPLAVCKSRASCVMRVEAQVKAKLDVAGPKAKAN